MIGQIVFNSGGLGANRNVSGKLGMKLAIDYCSSTWGTKSRSNLEFERLSKLQKRAARIILNAPYDTASSVMFITLGWPNIEKRHGYNKAVLTYKALDNLTPLNI